MTRLLKSRKLLTMKRPQKETLNSKCSTLCPVWVTGVYISLCVAAGLHSTQEGEQLASLWSSLSKYKNTNNSSMMKLSAPDRAVHSHDICCVGGWTQHRHPKTTADHDECDQKRTRLFTGLIGVTLPQPGLQAIWGQSPVCLQSKAVCWAQQRCYKCSWCQIRFMSRTELKSHYNRSQKDYFE